METPKWLSQLETKFTNKALTPPKPLKNEMEAVMYGDVWPKEGKRLMRSIYSKNQVEALEELFQSAKYLHKTDMEQAALTNQNLSELFQRLESANELFRMESEPSID